MRVRMKKFKRQEWLNNSLRFPGMTFFLISFSIIGIRYPSSTQIPGYTNTPFKDGELLRYKVKWGFIRLGTIEISQEALKQSYYTKYLIQLNAKSIRFKVVLDATSPTRSNFILEESGEKETSTVYWYDPLKCLLLMEVRENGSLVQKSSLFYERDYYDVLSLIMLMRCLSDSGLSLTLPTIIGTTIKDTDLNFTDYTEEIKVSALERAVRARRVEGKANWKAWGGISGPFRGWFSDDEAAIPLKFRLRIFLGSVTLELEEFYRPDWEGAGKSLKSLQYKTREVSHR